MATDRFGAFLPGVAQATRRALEELRRRIDTKVDKSGDTMTGALTIDTPAGSANQVIVLPEGYSVYADNTGPGTDASRLWFDGPDEGAVYIGPRAGGGAQLDSIYLRADEVRGPSGYHIVERGSNANGEWVKFYDGTMICWRFHTVTDQAISTAYGSLFIGARSYTFPVAFSAVPAVAIGECHWGTAAPWGTAINTSVSTFTARFFDVSSRATGTSMDISWQAVGRWV